MKLKINKNKALDPQRGKPSRFLLELKNEVADLSDRERKKTSGEKRFFQRFFSFWRKIYHRFSPPKRAFIDDEKRDNLRKTSFYPVLKIFYKVSKFLFWIFAFLLRFVYFSFLYLRSFFPVYLREFRKKSNLKQKKDSGKTAFIPKGKVLGEVEQSKNNQRSSFFKKISRSRFSLRALPSVLFFTLILLIFSLPFFAASYHKGSGFEKLQGKILGASELAMESFGSASEAAGGMDFQSAQSDFVRAADSLLSVKIELEKLNQSIFFLASIIPNKKIQMASEGKKVVEAGIISAEIGTFFSDALSSFSDNDYDLAESLPVFRKNISLAATRVGDLKNIFDDIEVSYFPDEHKEKIFLVRETLADLSANIDELLHLSAVVSDFVGMERDKRYLFVFQNNAEMRGSGGFIGSYALVDFSDGKIENMEVPGGGSYDTDAGLRDFIIAPEPLHLINPQWHFWDANWWPDFKKSAEKLMWFYEHSDGPSVDGVIALDPTVIERFLEVIGPIDMKDEYGLVINKDNFWLETQNLAERKNTPDNKPKKIIGDLAEKMIDEMPARINKDNFPDLLKMALNLLNEKHIMFFFKDDFLQEKVRQYSWSGEMSDSLYDYLMVVNTNVGGGKSDRSIKQNIFHRMELGSDGYIYDTLEIVREHQARKGDMFSGVRNNSWLRVYVPAGSVLLEADGFRPIKKDLFENPGDFWDIDPDLLPEREAQIHEKSGTKIYDELGKTVFANWSWVDPGKRTTVRLKYKLPFKIDFSKKDEGYLEEIKNLLAGEKKSLKPLSLLIQKQPGDRNTSFVSEFKISGSESIFWSYGFDKKYSSKKDFKVRGYLDEDRYWAVLLEK